MSETSRSDEPALQVRDLQSHVGTEFSLGPLSFALKNGRHLGIIGLSGSGKSTLLRTLALFIMPDKGTIETPLTRFAFGGNFTSPAEAQIVTHRRQIAYIGQGTALWPHLTVAQNIDLGLKYVLKLPSEERRNRVSDILRVLEITHLAKRRTWEISGGEARRVAVARIVALRPRVILLDEPDTGLDPLRSKIQMDLILAVCKTENATLVVVSHNPVVIEQCADDVLVIDSGREIEMGPASRVLNVPEHEATRRLVRSAGWFKHPGSSPGQFTHGS